MADALVRWVDVMRVFKLKDFARCADKARIEDRDLCEAVSRAESGLIDAAIGKFLIKQRVARVHAGRSSGYRAIVVFKLGDRAIFAHMFPKNRKANLTVREESAFRDAAREIARLEAMAVSVLIAVGEWIEVDYGRYQESLSQRTAPFGPPGDEGAS